MIVGLLCGLVSCEKDQLTGLPNTEQTQVSSALHFVTPDALKLAVTQLSKKKDKLKGLDELRSSGLFTEERKFNSLAQHKIELLTANKSTAKNTIISTQDATNAEAGVKIESELELIDDLVPDPNFAAVLNENMEIQVADKLYKITPQGTYFTNANNSAELERIVTARVGDVNSLKKDQAVGDYLYQVQNGVYRYDTYGEAATHTLDDELVPVEDCPGGCPTYYPTPTQPPVKPPVVTADCSFMQPTTNAPFAIPQQNYCNLESFAYGSKTVVGGWLESIFGANSDRTVNFDGDHRVKVKLYNFNYFVYSSVGLKVKFQKQGWTGIWDARDTEKLVIGWDAMIFETPLKYNTPYPYNSPSFPGKAIAKEILRFINFNVEAGTLTQLDESLLGRDLYGAKEVSSALKSLSQQTLASATKKIWTYVNKELNPGRQQFLDSQTKAFRLIFPDKFTTALSRWELSRDNDQEIDCIFDFNTCRITYNGYIDGNFDWFTNVAQPTFGNQSYSYKIVEASIYGAAKYNGQWKGARIIQEKED